MDLRYGLVVVAFTALSAPAGAQEGVDEILSVVDACDVLAAHPDDPLRVAPGVPEEELVPRLARRACEDALAGSDDVARHAFQLGRALLEQGDRNAALERFQEAADAGSAIALVFLGDAAQFGWVGEMNPDVARGFYEQAIARGFVGAELALDQVTLDTDIFTAGPMLQVLVDGRMDVAIEFGEGELARAYLYAFAQELSARCGAFLDPNSVQALQEYRFPEGWNAASETGNRDMGLQDVLATYDVEVLVDRHGCSGYIIETIAGSFNDVVMELAEGG